MSLHLLTPSWDAHALVDSGHGRKLERVGDRLLDRPEPKAWWKPRRETLWREAAGRFREENGKWRLQPREASRQWPVSLGSIHFEARLTDNSKHFGFFPEQEPHWSWLRSQVPALEGRKSVLNLFGYTGAASLVLAQAGASVTHIDASKPSVAWGRHNQQLSGMGEKPIRWILEDALKFVGREIRRGHTYEGITLDPPSFGRGPSGEVWKVETRLIELLTLCKQLLSPRARFLLLTLYNLEASPWMLGNLLADVLHDRPGKIEIGELALREEQSDRLLPLSLFARWTAA